MENDKLKQELFYMYRLTSKYDFSKMEVVENILRLENDRKILDSVFGRRFKTRIFDIAAGINKDSSCVLCGQPADNQVICPHCMETISGSEYAKLRTPEQKSKFKINYSRKDIFKYACIFCLSVILIFQIWILSMWVKILNVNKQVPAKVSDNEPVAVADADAAAKQLALDFPEEEGYTITYARPDREFVGRFKINKGDCCEEVEEKLTDEERYDYFFKEDVYIFYISYNEKDAFKLGLAEVNNEGSILVLGQFNDGRATDVHYKYR